MALIADIRQMYHQIVMEESCRRYQHILWRFSIEDPIEIYEFNCVVFGVSSSPYLALRTVHRLVEEEGDNFPAASTCIPSDMFVEDLVTSAPSLSDANNIHSQTKELFKRGGFESTKWRVEYLHELQERGKWWKSSTPLEVGTVVIVDQPNLPPLQWPLGIVEQVFPGTDGQVRVALIEVFNECREYLGEARSGEINIAKQLVIIARPQYQSIRKVFPFPKDYEVDLYLRQKWQDERLKHADITEVLDLNDPNLVKAIWKPEVYFPNAKHAEFQFVTVPNVLIRINPDGEILYMLRLKLTFSCMMDLSKFPLDSQICTMEVSSFSKTTEELRLEWKSLNPVIMGKGLRMPQFEIVNIKAAECQESFQIGNYSCLVAEFYLSRSVGFHLVQSYLPTILIVVISWVSFWMDVDSVPGRTTLGVTTLLAVSSQSSGIQSGLPQVSYVKAIDVWMGTCTAFVFCALLEFTFVNYMWRKIAPDFTHNNVQPTDSRTNGKDMLSNAIALNLVRKSTVLQGQLTKNMKTARKIDEYSRLLFPLAFAMFNILYWTYYLR
ncbi:glycine receptor subunit beta-type 4 [Nilaparvata lugens]|uniref:glycine receptor subunit beta-type 4 n=1 Tax=Nilaparvata lugens TaxID=108931 RepID=UPI00193E09B0|nr:glycine receptor subunit beta-type 4 [Nilaparvata lugens]